VRLADIAVSDLVGTLDAAIVAAGFLERSSPAK